jgi:cell division protein FtsB
VNPPERSRFQGVGRRIIFGILLVGLALGFVFGRKGLLQWDKLRRRARDMEMQNDSLQREILGLSVRIRALEAADSLELERAARQFGLARPGEEVFLIREDSGVGGKTAPKTGGK